MDVKDLRTEPALSERNNDGSKYSQSVVSLQCNRNKSYQDIGSNALGKAEGAPVRPCAVIGPDRVVPPPASNDAFLKKGSVEPWPSLDSAYRRPPDYPHRLANLNPARNISPRQTFQENMQRINVQSTYNAVRHSDSANFSHAQDRNVSISKNVKPNMAPEAKFCDVPYAVNNLANEPNTIREPEMYMQSVNPSLPRTAPHVWPPGSVNVAAPRTYSAGDPYQYQQYSTCASQRPTAVPVARCHRTIQEEAGYVYPEHYYPDANARFKPFPNVKDRYPQARYEYLGNYPGQFHPPPPIQPPKYDIPKPAQTHPYPVYPHLKYLENRLPEPTMESYQRQASHQAHYNISFRNQVIHPPYGQMPGSTPQKVHPYPPEASIKAVASNKLHYENNTKMYIDYENARSKTYPVADNYFVNEMNRYHQVKNPMAMPNYSALGTRAIPPHQYYVRDNPQMRPFEYMPHFRNFEPHMNASSVLRHAPQFSPNTLAISPTDSNASNDTLQTHPASQEDCGYVSQSSTASVRSMDSGIYRLPHEYYKKPEYKYGHVVGSSPTLPKSDVNSKDKQKLMNVRQFLSMWNEGEEENPENNNSKEIIIQTGSSEANNYAKHLASNQDQLYVLGLVNVPSEELSKYEHIEKISKLPENIKGYNNQELYSRFEEAMESCNNTPKVTPKEYQMLSKDQPSKMFIEPLPRPVSPLDVEAKISQSVIHKEVGCNFEIRPCTPKMLNVEVAAPVQNVLGERLIEKVTNPNSKIVKSPVPAKSEESFNCHTIKKPENSFAITDNPSCKMTCSPFSSSNMEPIKTNYSLQDFNSGVCLASLPQLDNEIEFPEVNQQFINANKGDCLPPADNNYKSNILQSESSLPDNGNDETDLNEKSNLDSEKSLSKLSKYRKIKAGAEKIVRTDSVIIKNPENIKNIEDKLLENSFNPTNLCSPINLSSQSSQWHNSPSVPHENKDAEMALDFSLNKAANDLPIIDLEKDTVTQSFQANVPLEADLQRKHVLSPDTMTFTKEITQEANEVVSECIGIDQNIQECDESDKLKEISRIDDNLLVNSDDFHKPREQPSNNNDYKDVYDILDTQEKNDPKQLDTGHTAFSTTEKDLASNEEKGGLGFDIKVSDTEPICDTYCENVKKVFSPDQYNKLEQIDNDFEHDEISANLEKLFRESDEDLLKSDHTAGSNITEIALKSSVLNTSESLLKNTNFLSLKSLSKTSCRINKELFSPWIQKLLTYSEGYCLFNHVNDTSVDSNLFEKEISQELNEVVNFKPNKSATDLTNTHDLIAENIPSPEIFEDNSDTNLNVILKKSMQLPSESFTAQYDTKDKINKLRIKNISGNLATKTYSSQKETKKRKKRLHKSKSMNEKELSDQTKGMDEKSLGPQTTSLCEHKLEIKTDATIENTNSITRRNDSCSPNIDFIHDNTLQNYSKCHKTKKIPDTTIDSSVVSENSINFENSANEISLTENYSKILAYCNTPEDDESMSTNVPDNNSEYQQIKQLNTHESKDDPTELSEETANCLIDNIDGNNDCHKLSCIPEKETEYAVKENCESQYSTIIRDHNVSLDVEAANSETTPDGHLQAKNFELHESKNNVSSNELSAVCVQEVDSKDSEIQDISDGSMSCTDKISKSLDGDTVTEGLTNSPVQNQNMDSSCATSDHSPQEIPNENFPSTSNEYGMEMDTSNQNYSPEEELSLKNSINLDAIKKLNESAADIHLKCMVSEPLSYDKSLQKADIELNMSKTNNSCTENLSCNGSNNVMANIEVTKSATIIESNNSDSFYKLEECNIEQAETIQVSEDILEVVTDVCDVIDAQVSEINENECEVNKQNINEEEVPYDNSIGETESKNLPILSENSVTNTKDENTDNEFFVQEKEPNMIELISATDTNVGITECESDLLNPYKRDSLTKNFVDTVVSIPQSDKENKIDDYKILTEEETSVALTKIPLLECEINIKDSDDGSVVTINSNELSVLNCALNNLSESVSDETNTAFDEEIHSENKLEIESNEVTHHKEAPDKCYPPKPIDKSTDGTLGMEKNISGESNNLKKNLSPNFEKSESGQNNAMLGYTKLNDLTNVSDDVTDNWIDNEQPPPSNRHIFSNTEEDFILYDNSEENLCYPVVNNSLEIENESCVIPDTCLPVKSRLALKRSYSDSALNSIKTRDTSERQMLDNTPMWPPKRQKMYQFNQSEQQIISENICNFIQSNRRNSVSSFYNAENVSFCILIDDDCILTEENEEDKICFAEVAEDCITETNNVEDNTEEIVCCSEDTDLNLSDSIIMDYNDKSIQETWLDDVACVETVVSDEIVEETSNDAPLSPVDTNSLSEHAESGVFNSDLSDPTNGYNISAKESEIENVIKSPYGDDDVFHDREPLNLDNGSEYAIANNEDEISISLSGNCSPTSDYTRSFCISDNGNQSELPDDKENIYDSNFDLQAVGSNSNPSNNILEINCSTRDHLDNSLNQRSEEIYFPESSMDNVFFNYNKKEDEDDTYSPTSSSPEVSSTTSEDKSSSILLKITNYNGSRVSEVNEVNRNRPRCKFTEAGDYSHSQENFPKRPLMTKAARKYIPPLKESIRDLKVQLPLPQQRLLKLKQLKLAKSEPKPVKQSNLAVPKKPKPNFEDVLKSIDEVQIKMHKEKSKKTKNIVPKVVIKKTVNGSHYTSSSSKQSVDPDLTGRKWQPWVFLEKNRFIDNMAIKNKTKAVFSHRKKTYVLAEKFQKYKSASNCSAKFVISQPNSGDSSKGHLKYTIRLKHAY